MKLFSGRIKLDVATIVCHLVECGGVLLSKIFPKNGHMIRKIGNLKNQIPLYFGILYVKREFFNSKFSNYMSDLEQNVT